MPETRTKNVSQDQFDTFASHTDKRFNAVQSLLDTISRKLDEQSRPNYANWIALMSVVVVIAGMAGALTITQIKSASQLHDARDNALEQKINFLATGSNRFSRDDFKYERGVIDERFDESRDRVAKLNVFDRETVQRIARLEQRAEMIDMELGYRKVWMDKTHERGIRIESQLQERAKNQDRLIEEFRLLFGNRAKAENKGE